MSHSVNHGKLRLGKMAPWQKWSTYLLLSACLVSGLIWFVLADIFIFMPTLLKPWWVAHGSSSMLCLLIFGAAVPHHMLVTWRSHRNRLGGLVVSLCLLGLVMTALLLFYGTEALHDAVRWIHITLGLGILILFPWHIVRGKKSVARIHLARPATAVSR